MQTPHQLQAIEIDQHSAVAAANRLRRPEARRVIGAGGQFEAR